MAETEQTKVCPLCAETIKAAAKVCPYCRKSQRQWAFLTLYDFGAILAAVIICGSLLFLGREFHHGRDFGSDRSKVRVTGFNTSLEKGLSGTNVVMIGILTNGSGDPWRIEDFQIRFLDEHRKLVGVSEPLFEPFTVLPNSDHAFRLNLYSAKSIPNYATCTVQIVSARDPKLIN